MLTSMYGSSCMVGLKALQMPQLDMIIYIYIGVSVARGKAIKLHKSDLWNFGFQTKKNEHSRYAL